MSSVTPPLYLRPGREKASRQRHPWVFSGSLDRKRMPRNLEPGSIVELRDAKGAFVARGFVNPDSGIRIRLLSWNEEDIIDDSWWQRRLKLAVQARRSLAQRDDLDAYRLVNGENDGLPGLVVDRYGDFLVVQALAKGIERVKASITQFLADEVAPRGIWERSDNEARRREGLPQSKGLLFGEEPPESLEILELGIRHPVDIRQGHKTGFYLDQREARHFFRQRPELEGKDVLNAFSYTGAFSVCAALAGASSVSEIESSKSFIARSQDTLKANGLPNFPLDQHPADVFRHLRAFHDAGRRFGAIVLDPPKFAASAARIRRASRGYQDINRLAFSLLEPGGLLLTFSCSGHISPELFGKIVFSASIEAGVEAQVVHTFGHPEDHPVALTFPEGRYLKGLACRVSG